MNSFFYRPGCVPEHPSKVQVEQQIGTPGLADIFSQYGYMSDPNLILLIFILKCMLKLQPRNLRGFQRFQSGHQIVDKDRRPRSHGSVGNTQVPGRGTDLDFPPSRKKTTNTSQSYKLFIDAGCVNLALD